MGAGGFIGSHLLEAILERTQWRIFAVDLDFHKVQQHLQNHRIEFLCEDLEEPSVLKKISSYPIVIQLAAICTPSRYNTETQKVIESNFLTPAALAKACADSGSWLLYFSTSEVYGKTSSEALLLEEDQSDFVYGSIHASRWSYAIAKQLSERYIASLVHLSWTIFRPFNFIGPRMDFVSGLDGEGIPRVLASFCGALVKNEAMKLVDGGKAQRSFTSIHDAIRFIFLVLEKPHLSKQEVFNIGNPDNEISIRELSFLIQKIHAEITHKNPKEYKSPIEVSGTNYYGKGYEDSLRRVPSIQKSQKLLGYLPTEPLEKTLKESVLWFIDHYTPIIENQETQR